jgi:hypothetical protein
LWLVLPDVARTELAATRAQVDRAIVGMLWCVLSAIWSVWTPWAAVAAVVATAAAHRWWVRPAISDYGDLVEAAFHTHRFALYDALRLGPPANAGDEQGRGKELNSLPAAR